MGILSPLSMLSRGSIAAGVVLCAASAWPLGATPARAARVSMVIVMMASFPGTNIDIASLRRAFSGLATDLAGKRLIPINHPNGTALRVAFDQRVLGLQAADVGKFWIEKRIRDEGSPPRTISSVELAVRVAASLPAAVTYALPANVNPTVKVLTIDGMTPTQAGYPLSL